tara:strand:+ start:325 stop:1071 length:747 start_codon:yes stop_codon:yes gene_type:complete
MSKTVILIPSRLSATRLPNKPLLKIDNLSIIQHVYKRALESKVGKVYVVTGDKEIAEEIQKIKGKFILTKKKHKTGTDRIFEAYKKINKKLNCEYIINLQGDEPFIDSKDIINLNKNVISKNSDIGTLGIKISKADFADNNIVKVITEQNIEKKKISKAKKFLRYYRYTKKNIYGHIGIYQFKSSILKKFVSLKQTKNEIKYRLEQLRALENDINIDVVYTKNKSFGIDTVKDYVEIKKIMEYKINKL